jgi:ubiquinone/menaquinone biosynthesis C-methylase UbiE
LGVKNHKAIVREEFTRQAEAYASAVVITDQDRLTRLVGAIAPDGSGRAIEIATGPGYVAMALAAKCCEVIGIDLTEAALQIAERTRLSRGLANVRFRTADAEALPFADNEFDIAVCRFAFHHFEYPAGVLTEMCRVCRTGATIAVEDLYASEFPPRASYYNHFERLRDHSHTRAMAPTELTAMFAKAGVELRRVHSDDLVTEMEAWLQSAQTAADDAAEVRRLLEQDVGQDLSGASPFQCDGTIMFHQRTMALIGRKLG